MAPSACSRQQLNGATRIVMVVTLVLLFSTSFLPAGPAASAQVPASLAVGRTLAAGGRALHTVQLPTGTVRAVLRMTLPRGAHRDTAARLRVTASDGSPVVDAWTRGDAELELPVTAGAYRWRIDAVQTFAYDLQVNAVSAEEADWHLTGQFDTLKRRAVLWLPLPAGAIRSSLRAQSKDGLARPAYGQLRVFSPAGDRLAEARGTGIIDAAVEDSAAGVHRFVITGAGWKIYRLAVASQAGVVSAPAPAPTTDPTPAPEAASSFASSAVPGTRADIMAQRVGFGRLAGGNSDGSADDALTWVAYVVTNLHDSGPGSLRDALSLPGRWITFTPGMTGTIRLSTKIVPADRVAVIGDGADVTLSGPADAPERSGAIIDGMGVTNQIWRNLVFADVQGDALRFWNGAGKVGLWVDHVTFVGGGVGTDDGGVDLTYANPSALAAPPSWRSSMTVSWSRWINWDKCSLVGADEQHAGDVALQVTFHHNLFDNCYQRAPKVRFGLVHSFNNVRRGIGEPARGSGAQATMGGQLLSELDVFDDVDGDRRPGVFHTGFIAGETEGDARVVGAWAQRGGNTLAERNPQSVFIPAYPYTAAAADAALVTALEAGAGAVLGAPPASSAPAPSEPTPSALAAVGFDGDPATTERVDSSDPTVATNAISQARFAGDAASHVVLSREDDFPDSLAGASLTAAGPLLLTTSASLTPSTRAEIDRVLPDGGKVYLIGGDVAIAPAVQAELDAAGYTVERLAGPSRVETAIALADEVRGLSPDQTAVAMARASGSAADPTAGWADSVTGGAYGARAGVPILVTPSSAVHPAVAAWLAADRPSETILLGGMVALSAAVAAGVPNARRVAGSERAGTAAAMATELWDAGPGGDRRFLVIDVFRPDGWAFGLAAAGLAADADAPLLVVNGDLVPQATGALVAGCAQVDLLLVGSTAVVTAAAEQQLDVLDAGACR